MCKDMLCFQKGPFQKSGFSRDGSQGSGVFRSGQTEPGSDEIQFCLFVFTPATTGQVLSICLVLKPKTIGTFIKELF